MGRFHRVQDAAQPSSLRPPVRTDDSSKVSGSTSGTTSDTASGTAPGTAPGMASGTASGMASGTASGTGPGTASGMASGTASGTVPGTASGTASGTAPGTTSETTFETSSSDTASRTATETTSSTTIGWCTFALCEEPFSSWGDHVSHQKTGHYGISASQSDAVCSLCLEVYPLGGLPAHLEAHSVEDEACSLCSARFLGDASDHYRDFHRVAANGNHTAPAPALAAAPRISVKSDFSMDRFGSRTPLLLSAAPRAVQQQQQAADASAPEGDRVEAVDDAPAVLGWCTALRCSAEFSSWESYVAHFRERHDSSLCALCLEFHSEPHGDLDLQCSRCPARFLDGTRLLVHKRLFHRVSEPPAVDPSPASRPVVGWCTVPYCGKSFYSWRDHVAHQVRSHLSPAQSLSMCYMCLAQDRAGDLVAHLEAHRVADVGCSLCTARFLGDLSAHYEDFHHATPDGRVPPVLGWCVSDRCNASFSSWEDHVQHFVRHHWKMAPSLVCHFCLRTCRDVHKTKAHVKGHFSWTNVHFNCARCSARFFSAKTREEHMRVFHLEP
ncbi:uncharacterized protein LOC117649219 [Thrips palmi]|uniref:Uncharacterized protein LOC117649219 n=1 Tax=Thrips palmi TaxID=161013 RepID=A0A6P8ZAA1_THRPL|nr:uncharacterized protein LOC117649219 [Thrips palmi]